MVPIYFPVRDNHAVTTTGSRVLDDSIFQIEMQIQNVCLIGRVQHSTLQYQLSIRTGFMLQRKGALTINESKSENKIYLIFKSSQYVLNIEFPSNPFERKITFAFALVRYKCTLSRGSKSQNVKSKTFAFTMRFGLILSTE